MNYQQTIDFLYTQLPMFSRMGSAAFKKDLTNIRILCEHLGQPQSKFKTVHVGGTNGKGSVSHMLAAVLQSAGYKTGLYTSPHLYDFRERIKVNGAMINEGFVMDFVERIKPLIEEIQPSFFEITVAMSFDFFAQQNVDVAVIEVGLGGRLDSTNIITPILSVITNVGWDHMNMLGDTLPLIAAEKGGIIKPNIPVVIGEKEDETLPVFSETAQTMNSPVFFAEERFTVHEFELLPSEIVAGVVDKKSGQRQTYRLGLPGIYQTKNIRTVLQAIALLQDHFSISRQQIANGIKEVKQMTGLYGRWEVILTNPTVVLEVAHNKNGIEEMLHHIKSITFNKLHLVLGIVKDKDAATILRLLPQTADYYFTQAQIPRALPAEELQKAAQAFQLSGEAYTDVNTALQVALHKAGEEDLIIVCGSIFLVAEVNRNKAVSISKSGN